MTGISAREEESPRLASEAELAREPELDSLAPGSVLDGRYRVVQRIGRGGMGQVYEARHLRLGRRVAVKILRARAGASDALRKRFEQEARAAAEINDERVVAVFDFGLATSDEPYLVMEYLDGKDLRALLREEVALSAPRAVALLHDVCLGLEAAHARGVIHRDIKPENLFAIRLRNGAEACKVLDFGLAKLRAFGASDLHTASGLPLGTLHYMSPEQARGDEDVDERTDVYGCAAVLYELLSGHKPHVADSPHALLYKITHEHVRRIEEHGAWIPKDLAEVVHRALEVDRTLRPRSIERFREQLEPFLASAPHASRAVGSVLGDTTSTEPVVDAVQRVKSPPPRGALRGTALAASWALAAFSAAGVTWFMMSTGIWMGPRPTKSEFVLPACVPPKVAAPAELASATHGERPITIASSSAPVPRGSPVDAAPRALRRDGRLLRRESPPVNSARPSGPFDRRNPYE